MKTWYKAVCDEHKEMLDMFVDSVYRTNLYLLDKDEHIYTWFNLHYGCKLILIHHDLNMYDCFNNGYVVIK